jgi:hypothetical protein
MAGPTEDALAAFSREFDGVVLTSGDPGYDDARSVWNGDINRYPAVIALCASAPHVAAAIGFARANGMEISVRGGGHNFAGTAVCDGGLMIDLSEMNAVVIDPAAQSARCGGGTKWAELDAAAQEHALAVPGGFISHTGIGGLTLGGGMGWLTNRFGLSCDNLIGAELVTADGAIAHVSAHEHPDLFWALRGGGGNFGVVTTFEFQLHDVGPFCQLGMFFWEPERGAAGLRLARDTIASLPEGVAGFMAALSIPPAPFVPEEHQLRPAVALLVVSWGSPEEHAALVQPVRDALPALVELVTPIPYVALQQMFDEGAPWGILGYEKALYLEEMSDAAIDVIVEHLARKVSPLSFVPIFTFAGAFARVADDATAFGGSRRSRFAVNIAAICPTPEMLVADRAWVRGMWEALLPFAVNTGSYVNFMTDLDADRVRAAYGSKYDRLAAIKSNYDPENVFHLNANIAPLAPA